MRRHLKVVAAGMMASVLVGAVAQADTLPPGATPVSGTVEFALVEQVFEAQLPVDVPKGQQFVLTDAAIPGLRNSYILIQFFAPDDLVNPRFEGSPGSASAGSSTGYVSYAVSFQTGLVFSGAPTVKLPVCSGCFSQSRRFSFSGYLKSVP